MNHEQWEALKARTYRHNPGPWEVWLFNNVFSDDKNKALAAAAPDLLAEVERLRGWIEWMERNEVVYSDNNPFDAVLTGAEVPE